MKFAFSTKNVTANSFLELCNKTAEYEFSAFEIFDAENEKDIENLTNSNNLDKSTLVLSVRTGKEWILYLTLTMTCLGLIVAGITLIKKYAVE